MAAADSFVGDGLASSPYKEALARAERAEAEVERLRALLQRAVDAIAALEGDEIMYSKALVLSGVHTDAIAALAAEGSDEAPHDGPCAT